MSLGLNRIDDGIAFRMITCAPTLHGYEITLSLGPVEGVVEVGYSSASVAGIGIVTGGGLDVMIFDAKKKVSIAAREMGADAVVSFSYVVAGRPYEKSVVAYGSAVKCRKPSTEPVPAVHPFFESCR